jgi:hypothetical protein
MVALLGRHGPPEEALARFRDAIHHWRASRNRALLVTTLRNLVVLLARTGRDESAAALAATLHGAAPSRSYGVEAARVTTALATVRRRLGDAAYDRAWTAGATRTLEAAADRPGNVVHASTIEMGDNPPPWPKRGASCQPSAPIPSPCHASPPWTQPRPTALCSQ